MSLFFLVFGMVLAEFVPSVVIGRRPDNLVAEVRGSLTRVNCTNGVDELHVVSFESGFAQSVVIDVARKAPVNLFIVFNSGVRLLQINALNSTVIRGVYVMSQARFSKEIVVGVDAARVFNLGSSPRTPPPPGWVLDGAELRRIIEFAEDFLDIPVTSAHGTRELSYLSLQSSTGSVAACSTCANGRAFPCNCRFGVGGSGESSCSGVRALPSLAMASVMPRLSNSSLAELALTATPTSGRLDAFGFGANMSCLLKLNGDSFAAAAYWRAINTIACRLDPSKFTKPMIAGEYDVSVVLAPGLNEIAVPGQRVTVLDGVRHCAQARTCNTCDKNFCVYCADSQACVPGNEFSGPSDQCGNWFAGTCPDATLRLGGEPQRALLQPGVVHSYSFEVAAPLVQSVVVDLRSQPRSVQMNTNIFIYLQRDKPVNVSAGAGVGYIQTFNNTGQVPKGDFQLSACNLDPATYYVAIRTMERYQYDIQLQSACTCGGTSAAAIASSISPTFGILSSNVTQVIQVSGSSFSDSLKRLSCRFELLSDGSRFYSAGKIVALGSNTVVECVVPSLDQLKEAPAQLKVPSRASVSVSNDGCNWSDRKLFYTQYVTLELNEFRSRNIKNELSLDFVVPALAPKSIDMYSFKAQEKTAVSFVARLAENAQGPIQMAVVGRDALAQFATNFSITCAGATRCGVAGMLSLANEYRVNDCSLENEWFIIIYNGGSMPMAYSFGVECGCQSATQGEINAVVPPAGSIEGFDFVAVQGVDFRPSATYKCEFDGNILTTAQYVSPSEVRCLTPAQTSKYRPSAVSLRIIGEKLPTLNAPCAVSPKTTFNYFIQLNRAQTARALLSEGRATFFLFDFSRPVPVGRRRAAIESFGVIVNTTSASQQFYLAIAQGELPQKPTGPATSTGRKTELNRCAVDGNSQYYIGLWSDGGEFIVDITITDPPACVGVTPTSTTTVKNANMTTVITAASHATLSAAVLLVAAILIY